MENAFTTWPGNHLTIGQKIIVFECHYKKMLEAIVVRLEYPNEILACPIDPEYNNTRTEEVALDTFHWTIDSQKKELCVKLTMSEYRSTSGYYWGHRWCFPENQKYINHMRRLLKLDPPLKKKNYEQYKDLDHNNNKRQIMKHLRKEEQLIQQIKKHGSLWAKIGHAWNRPDNKVLWEQITFSNLKFTLNSEGTDYLVKTTSGETSLNKIGTTLRLTVPEELLAE